MKTISDRLKEGMEIRGMKQTDLVERTGISKGALSSYISGRYSPKQNNIYLIAKALNVSEGWLLGADVQMERQDFASSSITINKIFCESKNETNLMLTYRKLSDIGKKKVNSYTDNLLDIEQADLEVNAAHKRTGIEVTDEMHKQDDDIMSDENF